MQSLRDLARRLCFTTTTTTVQPFQGKTKGISSHKVTYKGFPRKKLPGRPGSLLSPTQSFSSETIVHLFKYYWCPVSQATFF